MSGTGEFRRMASSKLGYWRGLMGWRYKRPPWVDEMVFALAYKEGHRVYLDRIRDKASKGAARMDISGAPAPPEEARGPDDPSRSR
jgi:hypothetical protein